MVVTKETKQEEDQGLKTSNTTTFEQAMIQKTKPVERDQRVEGCPGL